MLRLGRKAACTVGQVERHKAPGLEPKLAWVRRMPLGLLPKQVQGQQASEQAEVPVREPAGFQSTLKGFLNPEPCADPGCAEAGIRNTTAHNHHISSSGRSGAFTSDVRCWLDGRKPLRVLSNSLVWMRLWNTYTAI